MAASFDGHSVPHEAGLKAVWAEVEGRIPSVAFSAEDARAI